MLNATFSNISVILWQQILLVKEARVPGENSHVYLHPYPFLLQAVTLP